MGTGPSAVCCREMKAVPFRDGGVESDTEFVPSRSSTQDLSSQSSGKDSSFSADQDLKGRPRNISFRRRASSTAERLRVGSTTSTGYRTRLRTRSDVQEAVLWMEGEETNRLESIDETVSEPAEGSHVSCTDERRLLPWLLVTSLVAGGACMLSLQCQLLSEELGGGVVDKVLFACVASLYVLTLGFMAYAACTDPGQVPADFDISPFEPPPRSHKNFQYPRRIMRFDHYCRWILNCIGLWNHREFILMLIGLVSIAVLGIVIDVGLLVIHFPLQDWATECTLAAHLLYSLGFAYYVVPIVRLHMTFVSRNELANDWKDDKYYVVDDRLTGEPVWVGDLDADEFNERFDTFEYDPSMNPYDKGCMQNCATFWCTARWAERQVGAF